MPVLKAPAARPAVKDAVVLDLADIAAQADRLRAAAQDQARRILTQAQAQAEALTAGAAERGFAQGQAQGLEQGLAQGRDQGHAQALADTADRLAQTTTAWDQTLAGWEDRSDALHLDARQAVLDFALKLAGKVVHRALTADPGIVVDQVASALGHVLAPLHVTVCVHTQDLPLIHEALPELTDRFGHLQKINLTPDDRITRGGCVVRYGSGVVDATIEQQLDRIAHQLIPPPPPPEDPGSNPEISPGRAPENSGGSVPRTAGPDAASENGADTAPPPIPPGS